MDMLIKKLVDALGISIKRKQFKWERLNTSRVEEFTLNGLVHTRILENGSLSVVQVGAYDGISNNALDYSKLANICVLKAVLIEPNPVVYGKLVSNFRDNSSVVPLNLAIDVVDGRRSFTVVRPHNLAEYQWIEQLSSFDRDTILSHSDRVPDLISYMNDAFVDCSTLTAVLAANAIVSLDVLLIDTEGYDAVIVENALNLSVQPSIIVFEHTHLQYATTLRISAMVKGSGYSMVDLGHDFVCWKPVESFG